MCREECTVVDTVPIVGTILLPHATPETCVIMRKAPVLLAGYTLGSLASLVPATLRAWPHPLARHDVTVTTEADYSEGAETATKAKAEVAEVVCGGGGTCSLAAGSVCTCGAAGSDEVVVTVRFSSGKISSEKLWGSVRMVADTGLDPMIVCRILVGVGLAILAGWMASSRLVRLAITISLCVGLSVLILGVVLYRSLPLKSTLSWIALAFPSAAFGAVLWIVRDPSLFTQNLLSNHWVQAYVASAAAVGFVLESRFRPSKDVEASLEQLIRISGLFLVYTASTLPRFAFVLTAAVAVVVFRSVWWPSARYILELITAKDNRPSVSHYRQRETESFYEGGPGDHGDSEGRRGARDNGDRSREQESTPRKHAAAPPAFSTPSPRKRMTFEEYDAEGVIETRKAVSELKAYLKSASPILSQLTPKALEALAREYAEDARQRNSRYTGRDHDDDDVVFSDEDD